MCWLVLSRGADICLRMKISVWNCGWFFVVRVQVHCVKLNTVHFWVLGMCSVCVYALYDVNGVRPSLCCCLFVYIREEFVTFYHNLVLWNFLPILEHFCWAREHFEFYGAQSDRLKPWIWRILAPQFGKQFRYNLLRGLLVRML